MDDIRYAIEHGNYIEAFELLKDYLTTDPAYTDTIAILEASIYIGLEDFHEALSCIQEGLRLNPSNHELYFMMGMVYESLCKFHKAYLCFENALFYSRDYQDDQTAIHEHFLDFTERTGVVVPKASIIILNYNQLTYTINCITSIRKFCPPSAYELICVDNASIESPEEWLQTQPDIKYQINRENLGFSGGCNTGIRMAEPGNDIFLLNNDTLLTENALFWLRMGLYEKEEIGASGAVSNYVGNRQLVPVTFQSLDECLKYGYTHNIPMEQPLSYRPMLIGFAMLIKHTAFEKTGLLDERFFPGNYEDNDYSTRLILNDFKLVVCKNSFIYHIGNAGFDELKKHESSNEHDNAMEANCGRYMKKWHIRPHYSFFCRTELIELMAPEDSQSMINCLDIGCACGATLLEIQNRYPNAKIYGIELDPYSAEFASHIATVVQGNVETMDFPFDVSFDYIILGDILEHLVDPGKLLKKLKTHLSENGVIITSIPNILHYSAIGQILMGSFAYSDAGVLDRTHLRFFTLYDSANLLSSSGYEIVDLRKLIEEPADDFSAMNTLLDGLASIPGVVDKEQFYVTQYIYKAKPV